METHWPGTALGDPIEVGALSAVMGPARSSEPQIGAVKSNMAHLEGAAGVVGLLKSVSVLNLGLAPPDLDLQKLNPHVVVDDFKAAFPTEDVVDEKEIMSSGPP